ncbi:MAG: DJ-1/PfpI family protein, partial [Bacteroidales bacterium]
MKRLFFVFILFSILVSCNMKAPRVLIFIKDGSSQLEYMLTHEVGTMSKILKESGFDVTIATISGAVLKTDSITLTPDLKLGEVNIDDYAGFILPCMIIDSVTPEALNFIKRAADKDKPIAAQLGSVLILAKAGLLNGKKFAFADAKDMNISLYPDFKSGIYSGTGVIKDGNIMTSGICPWMAKMTGYKDGTVEL